MKTDLTFGAWMEQMQATLDAGGCAVVLMRHFEHEHQVPVEGEYETAQNVGAYFATKGFVPDLVISSELPRCTRTVLAFQHGNGCEACMTTYRQLNDARTDTRLGPDMIAAIKKDAKARNVEAEALLMESLEVRDVIIQRGREGSACIKNFCTAHRGKKFLVGSHGGSRLEPTVMELIETGSLAAFGDRAIEPPFWFERNGCAVALFNSDGNLMSIGYIGVPSMNPPGGPEGTFQFLAAKARAGASGSPMTEGEAVGMVLAGVA